MPLNIPENLPAVKILEQENIFIMESKRAAHQDIRPLRIALCNLMPLKIVTETDIIRILSNSPLQIELEFFHMEKHLSRNTTREHLNVFYKTFDEISGKRYDGLIITGAPVEQLEFEEVDYWKELTAVFDWSTSHVTNTLHICWGAQAALYHHYGIPKHARSKKLSGVFPHSAVEPKNTLFRGFDDVFWVPHSRYTETRASDIAAVPDLKIIATSPEAGVHTVISKDGRRVFVTGHFEYNTDTLKAEYVRDSLRGLPTDPPEHYFPDDDPSKNPVSFWRSSGNLFYQNWLNYFVYQETPFRW
jgi:homoserine O-succinyltransferase